MAAVRAVAERGGRSVVVTGKFAANAVSHLDALGIEVAAGGRRRVEHRQGARAAGLGAEVYVGDHIGDVTAARAADAMAVAVATGPEQCRGPGRVRCGRGVARPLPVPGLAVVLPGGHGALGRSGSIRTPVRARGTRQPRWPTSPSRLPSGHG